MTMPHASWPASATIMHATMGRCAVPTSNNEAYDPTPARGRPKAAGPDTTSANSHNWPLGTAGFVRWSKGYRKEGSGLVTLPQS